MKKITYHLQPDDLVGVPRDVWLWRIVFVSVVNQQQRNVVVQFFVVRFWVARLEWYADGLMCFQC